MLKTHQTGTAKTAGGQSATNHCGKFELVVTDRRVAAWTSSITTSKELLRTWAYLASAGGHILNLVNGA
jgi:hypothetical protein